MARTLANTPWIILLAAALSLNARSAWPVAEAGALLLQYPIHSRLVAMGATGVADNSDPSTIYYNPANVVASPRVYLMASKMRFSNELVSDDLWMGRGNAGVSWRAGESGTLTWGADFALSQFDYGESIATLPDGTPLGTFHSFEKAASLALGMCIASADRYEFRVGAAAKRWWAEFAPAEFTGYAVTTDLNTYAFDFGATVVMRSTMEGWSVDPALGFALVDAGPEIEVGNEGSDPLPTRFNFGTSVHVESPAVRVFSAEVPLISFVCNVDGSAPVHGDFNWGLGTELGVAQILFVRTGTHMVHDDKDDDLSTSGWGIGLGVPVSSLRIRFDYADNGYFYYKDHLGLTLSWVF